MFVDKAKIKIKAGNGGDGAVSFHREKYVAAGGPDGGDGGNGGNVVFQVDDNFSTLIDFRYKRKYVAQNGENGGAKRCTGKSAPDLVIKVPRGTVIREAEDHNWGSAELVRDHLTSVWHRGLRTIDVQNVKSSGTQKLMYDFKLSFVSLVSCCT